MTSHSVRPTDDEIESLVNKYSNTLFRLCFTMLGSNADAEDAVSETFLKYITCPREFDGDEHKKAWLIKVAANVCRDMLRFRKRHSCLNFDDLSDYYASEEDRGILDDVMALPAKYREAIYLFYIEGYKTEEISRLLSVSPAAVRKRLQYGRDILRLEQA